MSIEDDPQAEILIQSAVVGWQLHTLAHNKYDALPGFAYKEKKAYFKKNTKALIFDENGNAVPFNKIDTVESLKKPSYHSGRQWQLQNPPRRKCHPAFQIYQPMAWLSA